MHSAVREDLSARRGCPHGCGSRQAALTVAMCVADDMELDVRDLFAPSRGRATIALARQVAMYLVHVCYGLPLSDVGAGFGRDRTTVSYACRLIEERRDDCTFDRKLSRLEHQLMIASTS